MRKISLAVAGALLLLAGPAFAGDYRRGSACDDGAPVVVDLAPVGGGYSYQSSARFQSFAPVYAPQIDYAALARQRQFERAVAYQRALDRQRQFERQLAYERSLERAPVYYAPQQDFRPQQSFRPQRDFAPVYYAQSQPQRFRGNDGGGFQRQNAGGIGSGNFTRELFNGATNLLNSPAGTFALGAFTGAGGFR